MKDNRRYFMVGIFVVMSTVLAVSLWLWFSATKHKDYNIFMAVFTEPVDGITTDSVIKYNGVEVGKVKGIELDSKNPRNILVYLSILSNIKMNKNTYATMKAQGVTGLSYIDLRLPPEANLSDNLVPHNEPPYPKLTTKPSLLFSLSAQAQSIANNVEDVSNQVKTMLDEENLKHLAHIMSNLDKVSSSIADHSDKLGQSVDSIAAILTNVKANTENLNHTMKDISKLTNQLSKTTDNANGLITSVQTNTLQNINSVLLPNLNRTIINMNQSSRELEQFLATLNQNPSALLRGKTPAKAGPGE